MKSPATEEKSATKKGKPLRVFLADDHVLFRELLSELLAAESASYQIVGQAGTAKARSMLAARSSPIS